MVDCFLVDYWLMFGRAFYIGILCSLQLGVGEIQRGFGFVSARHLRDGFGIGLLLC